LGVAGCGGAVEGECSQQLSFSSNAITQINAELVEPCFKITCGELDVRPYDSAALPDLRAALITASSEDILPLPNFSTRV
jgi:hypothetical protein